jgi:hypothetical protein
MLKVVCCSTFSDWCKSLGDVISSMIVLCFCAETGSVVIYGGVFCHYYLFISAYVIQSCPNEVCWVCVVVVYGPFLFLP